MQLPIHLGTDSIPVEEKKVFDQKKKVYLIDLGTGTDRSLLPLSCGLVKSFAQSIPILSTNLEIDILMLESSLEEVVSEIDDPFCVGIACYCWNFLGSVDISRMIKKKWDCPVVWGGPQVPSRPHRIQGFMDKYKCVDILVHGEGELTFASLAYKLMMGEDLDKCSGISFRSGDSVITTPSRDKTRDLSVIPSPYLNGIFDEVLNRYRSNIVGALWETNRGCPFRCTFCDWGSALVNKVNYFDIERVKKEIEWVSRKRIHYVYATDANFGIKVDRDLDISSFFVEQAALRGFPNTLILNWTKNSHKNIVKIADVLLQGGIITNVTLSYQSLNPAVLDAIERDNIKPDYLIELKHEFHERAIPTYSELILGLPEETFESFIEGLESSISTNIYDQTMIYLCCVLENTQLREDKEKYGIETRTCAVGLNRRIFKFERFGEDEIVISTNAMTRKQWEELYEISFMFMALYNLKVAYFIMVFLHVQFGVKFLYFIRFVIDNSERYPRFHKAIQHIRSNRQLIIDNKGSVSSPEGSEGVAFTPHEASVFLLLSDTDETYQQLRELFRDFLDANSLSVEADIFDDVCKYQELSIPKFGEDFVSHSFHTTAPIFLHQVTHGKDFENIEHGPTLLTFANKAHDYETKVEFDRRRVSCGYSINLNTIKVQNRLDVRYDFLARNPNLAGKFGE